MRYTLIGGGKVNLNGSLYVNIDNIYHFVPATVHIRRIDDEYLVLVKEKNIPARILQNPKEEELDVWIPKESISILNTLTKDDEYYYDDGVEVESELQMYRGSRQFYNKYPLYVQSLFEDHYRRIRTRSANKMYLSRKRRRILTPEELLGQLARIQEAQREQVAAAAAAAAAAVAVEQPVAAPAEQPVAEQPVAEPAAQPAANNGSFLQRVHGDEQNIHRTVLNKAVSESAKKIDDMYRFDRDDIKDLINYIMSEFEIAYKNSIKNNIKNNYKGDNIDEMVSILVKPYVEAIKKAICENVTLNGSSYPSDIWKLEEFVALRASINICITKKLVYIDPKSNVSLLSLLIKIWVSIKDDSWVSLLDANNTIEENRKSLRRNIILALSECFSAYNHLGEKYWLDMASCPAGCFTRIISILENAHPEVNLAILKVSDIPDIMKRFFNETYSSIPRSKQLNIASSILCRYINHIWVEDKNILQSPFNLMAMSLNVTTFIENHFKDSFRDGSIKATDVRDYLNVCDEMWLDADSDLEEIKDLIPKLYEEVILFKEKMKKCLS